MISSQLGGDKGIEIGGTKGKVLTNSIRQTHLDFLAAIQVFVHAGYNIMDVDSKAFDEDFYTFRSQINELERRLASVITQAFDDAVTVFGRFKLLDSFEGLLEREIIQTDLEKKNIDLLNGYALDLKQVQEIFVIFKDQPPINNNAPPRAGAVYWVRGLMERIQVLTLHRKSNLDHVSTRTNYFSVLLLIFCAFRQEPMARFKQMGDFFFHCK